MPAPTVLSPADSSPGFWAARTWITGFLLARARALVRERSRAGLSPTSVLGVHGEADVDGGENREDVGLEAGHEHLESEERDEQRSGHGCADHPGAEQRGGEHRERRQ